MHTWNGACTHGMVHAHEAWCMHTWNGARTHGMVHAHMEWCTHTRHGACTHGMVHTHMEWCMHTRHGACTHGMEFAYTSALPHQIVDVSDIKKMLILDLYEYLTYMDLHQSLDRDGCPCARIHASAMTHLHCLKLFLPHVLNG